MARATTSHSDHRKEESPRWTSVSNRSARTTGRPWRAWRSRLEVAPEQRRFLDTALGILARGYVYREQRARVFAIAEGGAPVGVCLVKDLDDEPACYDLQQFLVDRRFQGRGVGTEALRLLLALLAKERRYDCVEVCVHQEALAARRVYEKAGFMDTGFIDPSAPHCLNLRCPL